jgi:antitoxin ParD1/3/4
MSVLRKLVAQVRSRTFSLVRKVDPSALHQFEVEDAKKESLINELKKGEWSGFVADFDGDTFLKGLYRKHARKGTSST